MFADTSRYAGLETESLELPDGRVVRFVRRRFLPRLDEMTVGDHARVAPRERLDQLAARVLGDPEQFWRLADANNVLDPDELVSDPGNVVAIPGPAVTP